MASAPTAAVPRADAALRTDTTQRAGTALRAGSALHPDAAPRPDTDTTQRADDAHYAAVVARDARFDGRLFIGVTSTGIYCRPVCRVRTPMRRNCRFFPNAARAEAAGFRPCLRCRPELAPGLSLVDSPQALAQHAARLIDAAVGEGRDLYLPEVAGRLGVTDRHLRRVFQLAHGVTPLDYLTTRRLLLAKQLLTDTPLPVTQVAHAAGFASLRRFNAAFAERYRLSPTQLRAARAEVAGGPAGRAASTAPVAAAARPASAAPAAAAPRSATAGAGSAPASAGAEPADDPGALTVRLGYRPPYDIDGVLRFFRDRALAGVEAVDGLEWRRTLAWQHDGRPLAGWIAARFLPDRHEVRVTVAPLLMPALGALVQRVRQALDLDADPALIDPVLAVLPVPPRPGLRVPNGLDGFEIAARVVLGQQITVAAARTLTGRLVGAFGEPIATPFAGLHRLFPTATAIAAADPEAIGRLGIVRQRVRALQSLAAAVHDGAIELHRGAPLQPTLAALRALPGIGEWSAQLIAMRALAWPDAFPASDIGLLNALGTRDVRAVELQAEAWRPWRAYAVIRLWQTLETGT